MVALQIIAVLAGAIVLYKAFGLWKSHLNHAHYAVYSFDELEASSQRLAKAEKSLNMANSALLKYQVQFGELAKTDKQGYEASVKKYCSELAWWEMAQAKLNYMREANFAAVHGKKITEEKKHHDDLMAPMEGVYHERKTSEMIAEWPWPKPHRG